MSSPPPSSRDPFASVPRTRRASSVDGGELPPRPTLAGDELAPGVDPQELLDELARDLRASDANVELLQQDRLRLERELAGARAQLAFTPDPVRLARSLSPAFHVAASSAPSSPPRGSSWRPGMAPPWRYGGAIQFAALVLVGAFGLRGIVSGESALFAVIFIVRGLGGGARTDGAHDDAGPPPPPTLGAFGAGGARPSMFARLSSGLRSLGGRTHRASRAPSPNPAT